MKHSLDGHERHMPKSRDEQPRDVDAEEGQIDQILADSFPASDAPPWTLGVTSARPKSVRKPQGRRVVA